MLGAGFEEIVTSQNEDSPDQEEIENVHVADGLRIDGIQGKCYQFVNGMGSKLAAFFEISIYFLIAATVVIGVIQTVPGYKDTMSEVEWLAVIVFTIEYVIRFIGAGVDPEFSTGNQDSTFCGGLLARMKFLVSFYSIIDLLAILPFYLAYMMPGSWVDEHDEYL